LFHFAPADASVETNGILTLESLPQEMAKKEKLKYLTRANKLGMSVEEFLVFRRGQGALRSVSFLVRIPSLSKCCNRVKSFFTKRQCWYFDYDRLLELGRIEKAFLVESPLGFAVEVSTTVLPYWLLYFFDETTFNHTNELIFGGCAHGIILLKGEGEIERSLLTRIS
jgi:hypothetical protein